MFGRPSRSGRAPRRRARPSAAAPSTFPTRPAATTSSCSGGSCSPTALDAAGAPPGPPDARLPLRGRVRRRIERAQGVARPRVRRRRRRLPRPPRRCGVGPREPRQRGARRRAAAAHGDRPSRRRRDAAWRGAVCGVAPPRGARRLLDTADAAMERAANHREWEIFTIVPVETVGGVRCAPFGLADMMNTGGALAATELRRRAAAAREREPRPRSSSPERARSGARARRPRMRRRGGRERWCRSATSPRAVSSPSSSRGARRALARRVRGFAIDLLGGFARSARCGRSQAHLREPAAAGAVHTHGCKRLLEARWWSLLRSRTSAPPPRNRPIREEDYLGALTAVDDALTLAPGSPSTLAVLRGA